VNAKRIDSVKAASLLLLLVCGTAASFAQNSILRGVVTDESEAVVPNATVTLSGPGGAARTAITGGGGAYVFAGLTTGDYTVQASAPQLVLAQPQAVKIRAGTQTLNLRLMVASTVQQIVVDENAGPTVSTDAASNATATVLTGDDLNSLSDDPEDLQADLQALAGPSAGPGGGAIYIDGFSSGELPPKESIREIRINQNPFSPEFDHLGLGRIEILTKPGTDKYHGSLNYNFANQFWNSRNPYSNEKAPLSLNEFENTLSGPISRRTSFALDANQNNVDNGAIVNAVTLDPTTLTPAPLLNIFKTIQRRTRLEPRVDYQLNDNNTVTLRYGFIRGDIQGAGIGGFNLTSSGYHNHYVIQTAQFIETSVHGATVNETRFQLYHNAQELQSDSPGPSVQVLSSFTAGGSPVGHNIDRQTYYELQNNTTSVRGSHTWRFGIRARFATDDNVSPQNFNGTFTFSGGLAPVLDANQRPQPVQEQIDSIERYRRTVVFQQMGLSPADILARGGGASQFSIAAGIPETTANRFDAAVFAGDDWRLRPNLTLNLGIRYEDQPNLSDARDIAPRVGFAWAPGGRANNPRPKTVVRGGFGIFYDRFALSNTLAAERYNGIVQQQYVVTNPLSLPGFPAFPNVPSPSLLAGFQLQQVVQELSPSLRSPYVLQSAATLERQLPRNTTLAVTYTNSRGFRELRSEDRNAPLPGTYIVGTPGSGVFPLGHPGPVFVMESSGVFRQNQLLLNVNSKVTPTISLFGTYVLSRAMSNTDGVGTFPANPYSFVGEYGPAGYDARHRLNVGGSINTKWNVRFNPLIALQSGAPFDITAGSDLYGTTLFNGRPGIATDLSRPGLIPTPYGLLDPNPGPGETLISRNFGRGPGQMSVNLRVSKVFGFGAERKSAQHKGGIFAAPAERHYNLSVSMSIRNLLNHTNPGPIIGNITSPLFGQANQVFGNRNGEGFSENANNRRLELQIRLAF
jgi:Carboxypeptidase regulatory-like domain